MRAVIFAALSAIALAGCATRPPIPAETSGRFVLEEDLLGRTVARGEFRTITGVRRSFTAHLHGTLNGDDFTLVEDFVYDDGERDQKTWRLRRVGEGRYTGTREDVVGEAVGVQDGDVFRLEYDVVLPSENGRGRQVRFRDVMAETADGVVINNATVGLWGLRVGRVALTIRRES